MNHYLEQISNIKLMIQDASDEFNELNQDNLSDCALDDLYLLKMYEALTDLQKYVLSNLVFLIQDRCVEIGNLVVNNENND